MLPTNGLVPRAEEGTRTHCLYRLRKLESDQPALGFLLSQSRLPLAILSLKIPVLIRIKNGGRADCSGLALFASGNSLDTSGIQKL